MNGSLFSSTFQSTARKEAITRYYDTTAIELRATTQTTSATGREALCSTLSCARVLARDSCGIAKTDLWDSDDLPEVRSRRLDEVDRFRGVHACYHTAPVTSTQMTYHVETSF